MRTIPATFGTREEAEAAVRRLEAIGVAADRILLKEVEETDSVSEPDLSENADGQTGASRAFFLSAKVSPEQIGPATEILKVSRTEEAPLPSSAPLDPAQQPTAIEKAAARWRIAAKSAAEEVHRAEPDSNAASPPLSAEKPSARPDDAVRGRAPQPQPQASVRSSTDWSRWGQYAIIYALLMVAAFTGGWLLGFAF